MGPATHDPVMMNAEMREIERRMAEPSRYDGKVPD
jgi:hypothetical protein